MTSSTFDELEVDHESDESDESDEWDRVLIREIRSIRSQPIMRCVLPVQVRPRE